MKFIILLALVGLVSCEIDWSTVQPIRQTKEWQEAFPDFASRVVENSVYDMPRRGGRVIRGDIAGPLDMPYQVGIVVHFPSTNGWCSGSLVSLNFVLSAASCFPGNPTATVLLGASDISRLYDIILANFIRPHESFSTITWRNDIALVQLSYPARLNQYIQLIRLPNLRQVNANFEGRRTNFGGWGQTSDDEEAVPTQKLSFIPAEVISNGACRLRYPTYIWEVGFLKIYLIFLFLIVFY